MKPLLLSLLLASSLLADKQIECLALNIYYEARSSNLADQAAVADVVLNRVESSKYPDTVCKVVKQARLWKGNPVRDKCQFSWYCDGKSDTPTDLDAWLNAQYIAYQMLNNGRFRGISENATHYHAHYVKPYWTKSFTLVGTIGAHKFYRISKD
jgi:N-acetylmuramoyl-L-alanine amidase